MNVLILKLGALGNVVLSLTAFAAIRRHHPDARITLLTTGPYAEWMAASPWFDGVEVDARPAWWDLAGVLRLRRMLRAGRFDRVYDLQTSSRSSHYLRLFPHAARPEWSGIAPGCSHPDRDPNRDFVHDIDRQHGQLRQAGITDIPAPDLAWCRGDIGRFRLTRPFALLAPGSAPHRLLKRWPAAHYRALAGWLASQGIAPVVIGGADERPLAEAICADLPPYPTAPDAAASAGARDATGPEAAAGARDPAALVDAAGARDLTGQTGFGDLADLGRAAVMAIGNDTGPMHLLATVGCPALVLFSRDSDPARCVPRAPPGAPEVRVLRRDDLATLPPGDVIAAVRAALPATALPATALLATSASATSATADAPAPAAANAAPAASAGAAPMDSAGAAPMASAGAAPVTHVAAHAARPAAARAEA